MFIPAHSQSFAKVYNNKMKRKTFFARMLLLSPQAQGIANSTTSFLFQKEFFQKFTFIALLFYIDFYILLFRLKESFEVLLNNRKRILLRILGMNKICLWRSRWSSTQIVYFNFNTDKSIYPIIKQLFYIFFPSFQTYPFFPLQGYTINNSQESSDYLFYFL